MAVRHFLTLSDLSAAELNALIQRAIVLKGRLKRGEPCDMFKGRVLAMLFEKSSTRTRVSFETAMAQCGGHAVFLSPRDTHLGRGETIEDTARVLSRMVDAVMIRTFEQRMVAQFAECSSVPVINGLTDLHHPCQLLADLQTYQEMRGSIQGKTVAWIGDGNNMCHSYIEAAKLCDFRLRVGCPQGYCPNSTILGEARDWVELGHDAEAAVKNADLVVTDTWASMGQEGEHAERLQQFQAFQVNAELLRLAKPDAIFMHCLPAHRGEEVTDEVLDGPQSVAWQEAENRLHAQKALLEFLMFGQFGD